MAGGKAVSISQPYRQQKHIDAVKGSHKAARIAGSFLSDAQQGLTERWGNTLARYCDYFIRY